jgi:hypothetical protein
LILSANKEQRDVVRSTSEQQLQAIGGNADLCTRILKQVDINSKQLGILAALQGSYSAGAPGVMSATPASTLHRIIDADDPRRVSQISQLVLHALSYREQTHRYENITPAYQETFQWVFVSPEEPVRWSDFTKWIQSDDQPLYWVTGKPGAGKSTLMRYIVGHPRTSELLKAWCKNQPLLTASFFFWNSGSRLQMSYEGLIRSLMHQILKEAPQLIPLAFPHRVSDGLLLGDSIFQGDKWSWDWNELLEACKVVLHEITKTHKVMIFIDGLDEYKGEPSEIIALIGKMLIPGIKACVSGRPWNQFQDAFCGRPHLRVEMLTSDDIERLVATELASSATFQLYEHTDPGFCSSIVKDVTERSEGVFLWVRLVTRSLLEGLQGGEKQSDLRKRLESLPTDLEELFEKILGSLDKWHTERASQLFQIYRGWTTLPSPQHVSGTDIDTEGSLPTLLDMSFADEDEPEYAISAPLGPISSEESNARAELMRRRLNACTKGLLEATTREVQDTSIVEVGLLHRTVKDYLQRPDVWKNICAAAPATFESSLRICNSHLMRLKLREPLTKDNDGLLEACFYDASVAMRHIDLCRTEHATIAAKLELTLDETIASLMSSNHWFADIGSVPLPSNAVMSRLSISWLFANYLELFSWLEKSLSSVVPRNRKKIITSEILKAAATSDVLIPIGARRYMEPKTPNRQCILFLLQNEGDPNYKREYAKDSTWDSVLTHGPKGIDETKAAQEYTENYNIIVEDFLRYGAADWTQNVLSYLRTNPGDTTRIKAAIEEIEKERRERGEQHLQQVRTNRKQHRPWSLFGKKLRF